MSLQYDVFVSHSGHDREVAERLRDHLASSHGLRAWIYEDNTAAGSYRIGAQESILQQGAAFVIVVSSITAHSEEVKYETSRAFALRLPRIPVFVSGEVARDEVLKGQLHLDAQNGVVLVAGKVSSESAARVADIVRSDLRARGKAPSAALTDGRVVLGRTQFIAAVAKELDERQQRAVVLYGPPGAGKTTVAKSVMSELAAAQHATESAFLTKDDRTFKEVLTRIQNALQLEADAGASERIVLSALAARVRTHRGMYLLIDNFEQVEQSARDDLFRAVAGLNAPPLTLLITTRQRFDTTLLSTSDHQVEPLPFPELHEIEQLTAEALSNYASISLFLRHAITPVRGHDELERARAMDIALIRDIAHLCRAHQGFPGAIEIAAKTFKMFGGIHALLAKVRQHRKLRIDGGETMAVAVRASLDLLDTPTREAFLLCAGFEGGFDDEAASAMLGNGGVIVDTLLRTLHDCGLVRRDANAQRWTMYLPILECARDVLAASSNGTLRERFAKVHAEHFLQLARLCGDDTDAARKRALLRRIDADRRNLVLAIGRALATKQGADAATLLVAAAGSFRSRGPASTLLSLAQDVDHCMDETDQHQNILHSEVNLIAARAAESLGRYAEFAQRAKESYERSADASTDFRMRAINTYIDAADVTGQQDVVKHLVDDLMLLIKSGKWATPDALCEALIETTYVRERTEGRAAADQTLHQAVRIAAENTHVSSVVRWRLLAAQGLILWRDGDTSAAIAKFQQSLDLVESLHLGDKFRGGAYTNIALASIDENNFGRANSACQLGREALLRSNDSGWLSVNYVTESAVRLFVALRPGAEGDAKERAAADTIAFLDLHERAVRDNSSGQSMALMLSIKGEGLTWLNRSDEAESTLLEARKWCREQAGIPTFERWFRVSMLLAQLAATRFDRDATIAYLHDAGEFVHKRRLKERMFPVQRTSHLYDRYCEMCRILKVNL